VENDKYGNQNASLYSKLNYIMRAEVARLEYIYGAGVSIHYTYDEMTAIKEAFRQTKGKAFFHYVLNPGELVDTSTFFRAGIAITELIGHYKGHYQVVMAVHFEELAGNEHIHFIANNIDIDTGKRMNLNRETLCVLKHEISDILIPHGISPILQSCYENDEMLL
jgi:hypothetical protein